MTNRPTEEQMVNGFAKIILGQYLTKIHGFKAYQEGAIDLLAVFMVKLIKMLAGYVKSILDMQGRTIPNALHLLAVVDLKKMVDMEDVLRHIVERRDIGHEEFSILRKYGDQMFMNVNKCRKQTKYSNIQYVPAVYTYDIQHKALPYRHPIDQCIQKPLPVAYKDTRKVVSMKHQKIEQLQSYHKTEIKKASSILHSAKKQPNQHNKQNEAVKKNQLIWSVATRRSGADISRQPKVQMDGQQLNKNRAPLLPAEEEDHKIEDNLNEDKKSDHLLLKTLQEAKKPQYGLKQKYNFTLKKAIVALQLPIAIQEQRDKQSTEENKAAKKQEKIQTLVRGLSHQPSQKREYGNGLDSKGSPLFSTPKKYKFELISYL